MRLTKQLLFLLVISMALAACSKKEREPRFSPGGGRDLIEVATLDGQQFEVKTKQSKAQAWLSSSQNLQHKSSQVRLFDFVEYDTNSDLLKEVPFIGQENKLYKVRYIMTNNYLKVVKDVAAQELALSEEAYAENIGQNLYQVPLVGYPVISYYKIERARNDLGELTSTLIEVPVATKQEATHVRINYAQRDLFKSITKQNVFPAEYFSGNWYMASTVVGMEMQKQFALGYAFVEGKVRFDKSSTSLNFVSLDVDERLLGSGGPSRLENQIHQMQIPAQYVDFKVGEHGGNSLMHEEEHQKNPWQNRKYVRLDFANTKLKDYAFQGELIDLVIEDDYFSYTMLTSIGDVKSRIKVSMMRAKNRNYTPKNYSFADQRRVGYFSTKKSQIHDSGTVTRADHEKLVFVNRFNPQAAEIKYYLSEESPSWVYPVAEKAIGAWNETFAKAGSQVKIVLAPASERKRLGDLRYNIINFIDAEGAETPWSGYGPSIADASTGEIISATSNVNAYGFVEAMISYQRRYVLYRAGLINKNSLGFEMTADSADLQAAAKMLPKFDVQQGKVTKQMSKAQAVKNSFSRRYEEVNWSAKNLIEEIESQCPATVKYAQERANRIHEDRDTQAEKAIFTDCAKRLAEIRLLPTVIHELGHNFGLRHNFYGSVDSHKQHLPSSSIMEYSSINDDNMATPGVYDVAAIAYAYGHGKFDGRLMYCTDEDVDYYQLDPLCARHDSGNTPSQVVENFIRDYYQELAVSVDRRDAFLGSSTQDVALSRAQRYFLPLLRYYSKWRDIVSDYAGVNSEYLERFDKETYSKLIQQIVHDSARGQVNREYKVAADRIYRFFRDLAFTPEKSCLAVRGEQARLFSLAQMSVNLSDRAGTAAISCADQRVQQYIAKLGYSFVRETGAWVFDVNKDFDAKRALTERPDVRGLFMDRLYAISSLTDRVQARTKNGSIFAPNFLDEINYRSDFENQVIERISKGIAQKDAQGKISYSRNFVTEGPLLDYLTIQLFQGIMVPSKSKINSDRMERFRVQRAFTAEELRQPGVKAARMFGINVYATAENDLAGILVDAANNLENLQSAKDPNMEELNFVLESLNKKLAHSRQQAEAFSVEQFVTILNETIENMSKVKDPAVVKALEVILAPVIEAAQSFVNRRIQEIGDNKADYNSFMASDLKSYYKDRSQFSFYSDVISERSKQVLNELSLSRLQYEEEREEVDRQMDLIYGIIRQLI